jgi:hypothetical protein
MGMQVPVGGRVRLVVTVKAYPNASTKYGETVCVAGICTDSLRPRWVRLYPVGFRDLPFSQRFRKYQEIRLGVVGASDPRPETLRPVTDTLEVGRQIGTGNGWAERRRLVEPLMAGSMCDIYRQQRLDGTSLGVFRPGDVVDLAIRKDPTPGWSEKQLNSLGQGGLFDTVKKSMLEKVPYSFSYVYRCDGKCKGHRQRIIDWEIAEAYRAWSNYTEEERLERIRQKWFGDFFRNGKDSSFFVGNMFGHPRNFLILGVFWPPAANQRQLLLDLDSASGLTE